MGAHSARSSGLDYVQHEENDKKTRDSDRNSNLAVSHAVNNGSLQGWIICHLLTAGLELETSCVQRGSTTNVTVRL
jgi:hypothetical protein